MLRLKFRLIGCGRPHSNLNSTNPSTRTSVFDPFVSFMMSFPYQPLDVEKNETRLVTILAGTFEEELQITLKAVSLDDDPEYEALSYVWGDPSVTKAIKLDGISFQVTENLESALRHLRHPSKDRVFWIDAICINQRDILERNTQVPLMSTIYGNCEGCIAWLGPEGDDTDDFISFFRNFENNRHIHEWPPYSHVAEIFRGKGIRPQAIGQEEALRQKNEDHMKKIWKRCLRRHPQAFEHLYTFMDRPWWQRVWTIQEFVLPEQISFLSGIDS